jgi:transposase InsO family protein
MSRKRFTAEKIIGMLRESEVALAQGKKIGEVCRSLGISEQSYRDEVLNREVFFTLKEAKVVIENWRLEYNTIRPHSSLNGLPPAPETFSFQSPQMIRNSSEWGSTLT